MSADPNATSASTSGNHDVTKRRLPGDAERWSGKQTAPKRNRVAPLPATRADAGIETPRWLLDVDDRPANLRFTGQDVSGPIVYLVVRAGGPLYVGMSRRGLGRPLASGHHALFDIQPSDVFYVWHFDDGAVAWDFEARLIARLQPERNVEGVGARDFTRSPWSELLIDPV